MAAPYSGTSVSGYNANPPPDDGSAVSTNLITWNSTIKAKIGDPLNTFATNVDANITTAFGKTLDGSSVVKTAVNYAAGAADQGRVIVATASGITVTTPDAGTVGTPFIFGVNNQSTGTITLAPNATNSQTLDGGTSGLVIQAGGSCFAKTDGTNWFSIAYKPGSNALAGNNYGFDSAINLNLQASVGSNLLTVAVKTKAGNDPSASDPVLIPFRDATIANGDPVWITLSSALSINTNATGASLGTANTVPFRLWVVAFNNAGTVVLALWQSVTGGSTPTAIAPLNEGVLQSTTGISAGATSAATFYTPNGTSLSSKAFRILGYVEYASGLTTAGTYASAPTIVQLFGPGIHKPGNNIQAAYATRTSSDTTTSTSITTTGANLTAAIAPTSAANLVHITATTNSSNSLATNADTCSIQIVRGVGGTAIGVQSNGGSGNVNTAGVWPLICDVVDAPGTTSSTTYVVGIRVTTGGTGTFHSNNGAGGSIRVEEWMV